MRKIIMGIHFSFYGECRVQIETETDFLRLMNEAEFVEVTVREHLQEKQ